MDFEVEFERLLDCAKQALSGVDIDGRKVLGFAGMAVLDDVVKDYEKRLEECRPSDCSYSPDGKHHWDGAVVVCSYCEGRK